MNLSIGLCAPPVESVLFADVRLPGYLLLIDFQILSTNLSFSGTFKVSLGLKRIFRINKLPIRIKKNSFP